MSYYQRGIHTTVGAVAPVRYYGAAIVGDDLTKLTKQSPSLDEVYTWYGTVTASVGVPGGQFVGYAGIWDMQTGELLEEYANPNYGGPRPKPPKAPKGTIPVPGKPPKVPAPSTKTDSGIGAGLAAGAVGLGLALALGGRKRKTR